MSNKSARLWAAMLMVLICGISAAAQQFSADQIRRDAGGRITKAKVYVGSGKVRMEGPTQGRGYAPDIVLINLAGPVETMIFSAQRAYMERSGTMAQQDAKFFQIGDPCAPNPTSTHTGGCKKLGADTVNGRPAEKWELTETARGQMATTYVWIDPRLHAVIKAEAFGTTTELQNIKEGPQPASLFEVPADYRKMNAMRRP